MNCPEARERLSDWLDDALSGAERAALGGHLEGCPDCRRELDGLRAAISLLSQAERPRAPVDFVDRVMARAYPVPWYRRLARRLFLPLGIKLPVEAAAMFVIAVLGVYLLQRTPELRDAARPEREAPASRVEPSPTSPPRQESPHAVQTDPRKLPVPSPRAGREAASAVGDQHRFDSAPPLATQADKHEAKKEADSDRLQKVPALPSQPPPAPGAAAAGAPAPAAPPAESRLKSRDGAEERSAEQSKGLTQRTPALSAKPEGAMSGALGRLKVKDRPAAERGLADLLARLGGRETSRRQEQGAMVIEVLIPDDRYADFARGLTELGAWTLEGQPTTLPTDPGQRRLSIRISE